MNLRELNKVNELLTRLKQLKEDHEIMKESVFSELRMYMNHPKENRVYVDMREYWYFFIKRPIVEAFQDEILKIENELKELGVELHD